MLKHIKLKTTKTKEEIEYRYSTYGSNTLHIDSYKSLVLKIK